MKNRIISVMLILNLITTIGILNFFIKGKISKEKETLKEMTESEQVTGLQTQINNLNKSHEEYGNYIKTSKQKIANAINMYPDNNATEQNTLEELSTMINNLTNIPQNTYYYEKGTEGDSTTIMRYKKVNDLYYACDVNGSVTEGTSATDVSSKTLVPYNAFNSGSINTGSAGYVSGKLYLGDGSNNTTYYEKIKDTLTAGSISSSWVERNGTFTLFTETTNKIYKFTSWGTNYSGSYWIDYMNIYFYDSNGNLKHEIGGTGMSGNYVSNDAPFAMEMNPGDYIQVKYQLSNNNGSCRVSLGYASVEV